MAEIVTSVIILASLLKLSVEAFDFIQAGRRQESDLKKLKLRLDVEKYRLSVWGEAMGLMEPEFDTESDVVKDILQMIVSLFNDTHEIEERYGCKRTLVPKLDENLFPASDEQPPVDHLAECFRKVEKVPRSSGKPTLYQKTRWTIYDRDKFNDLILEVKGFIDGLQDLTQHLSSKARQDKAMREKIQGINDIPTLMLISEACEADYPDISDAASMKIEIYSMSTEHKTQIELWADNVVESGTKILDLDIENLSITELKHQLRQLQSETSRRGAIGKLSPTPPKKPARLRSKTLSAEGPKKQYAPRVRVSLTGNRRSFPNSANMRIWTDCTGYYNTEAEFLGFGDGKLHLHKANGKKIKVPVEEIARSDLEHVEKTTGIQVQSCEPLMREAEPVRIAIRNIADASAKHDPKTGLSLFFNQINQVFIPSRGWWGAGHVARR
jgi:Prion-inhibition and propagation/SLA1 homology domain 1, SHD1